MWKAIKKDKAMEVVSKGIIGEVTSKPFRKSPSGDGTITYYQKSTGRRMLKIDTIKDIYYIWVDKV